jgi:hypothetical protein
VIGANSSVELEERRGRMEAFTIAAASTAITKIVDAVRNAFGEAKPGIPKWVWNVLALALGVVAALIFSIEPVELKGIQATGTALNVITGLIVGGLASGWHEVFSALSSVQKKNDPDSRRPRGTR